MSASETGIGIAAVIMAVCCAALPLAGRRAGRRARRSAPASVGVIAGDRRAAPPCWPSSCAGAGAAGDVKCSGTHEGEWRAIPATGRRFKDIGGIYIFKVKQGKLDCALAVIEDNLTRMRQLGLAD